MTKWYAKFLCLTLFFPALASASALPNVFVDEVDNDDPRYEEGAQWIEITNRTRKEVDTRGWVFSGITSGGKSIALTTTLKPNETLVVSVDGSLNTEESTNEERDEPSLPPMLSELVSDPEDGGEWVELYNPHETNVRLASFKLSDASGKKIALIGTIEPSEYFVVNFSSSLLNNAGDTLNLIDLEGIVLDSTTYGDKIIPKKGESFARDSDDLWKIATPTKGLPNRFPTVALEVTASDDDDDEEEEEVIITEPGDEHPAEKPKPAPVTSPTTQTPTYTGVVTALPGLFGTQIAYIDGYQLYLYRADWPTLSLGDTVRIKGEIGESRSEARIKLATGDDLSITGPSIPAPKQATTKDAKTEQTGALVTLTGTVVKRTDRILTIEDAEGSIDTMFIDEIDLDLKSFVNQGVAVTGIIRTLNANPRLYPRSADDIALVLAEEPAPVPIEPHDGTEITASNRALPKPLIGGGFVVATAGSGMLFYLKHKLKLFT